MADWLGARKVVVLLLGAAVGMGAAMFSSGPAGASRPVVGASMSVDHALAYLDDDSEPFVFTVSNTGTAPITEITIAARSEAFLLPLPLSVTGCPSPPAGWSATATSSQCRFTTPAGNALAPGQSRAFTLATDIAPGGNDRTPVFVGTIGGQPVVTPSAGLPLNIHSWEITDVIVNTGAPAGVGGSCPAPRRQAPKNTAVGMIVCGINHTTATATPGTASLGGTFVNAAGTWSSGPVAPGATPRVLGNWAGTTLSQAAGPQTVVARVQSPPTVFGPATSPFTTFGGYTTNQPPVAVADAYPVNEDSLLTIVAPGVLGNDSDPDGDPITVVVPVVDEPDHGDLTMNANGGFTYQPDPNFHGTDSFTYQTTDGQAFSSIATVTITVTPQPDPPTGYALSPSSVGENLPVGSEVGTLSTTDADLPGDTHTYTLVAGTGSDDNGAFQVSGNKLLTSAVFDFEADSSYSVRIRSTDSAGNVVEGPQTITITNVNEVPTNLTLDNDYVPEHSPAGTLVGYLVTHDPDAGDTFTYSLVPGVNDADNASFEIFGQELRTAAPLGLGLYEIRLRVTDSGGLFREETYTIEVINVNDPSTDITLSPSSVAENQPVNTLVGTLSTTDPDAGDTFTYTLVPGTGDDDNASFQISGNQLRTNAVFDLEADATYSVRVRTTDLYGLYLEKQLTITITDGNDSPTDITLTPGSVAESQPVGTVVGSLSAADPDASDTHTFTLVSGTGDDDNASFQISGDQLQTNAVFDFEADSSYSVRVEADDGNGGTFQKQLTVTVTDVNEAPTDITLGLVFTAAENQPVGTTFGSFSTTDPDAGNTHTYTLVSGTGSDDNASFQISGGQLLSNAIFDYEIDHDLSIRVRTTDQGGLYFEEQLTVNVNDVPDAPTDIALSPTSVAENQPSGTTVGTLSRSDQDGGSSATYTLVSGAGDDDNGTFQISGDQLQTNAVFDFEADSSYAIRIRVTDNNSLFYEESFIITITDANDSPTDITLTPASVAENQPVASPVGDLTATDPDVGDSHTFTLVAGTGDDDNASFQISGDELRTNAVLDFEAASSYSVRVRADDGQGGTYDEQLTITITNVNDAPVAVDDSYGASTGSITVVVDDGVLDNDSDPDGDALTAVLVTGPAHTSGSGGSFAFNTDGSFSYVLETGSSATSDTFTYRAVDGASAQSNVATVTINFNQPPTAVDDVTSTNEDTPVSIEVSANDTDAETANAGLTAVAVGSAVNGTAVLQADNRTVIFTPAANVTGSGLFTYKAFDGSSQSTNTATVTITITAVNDAPVLANLEPGAAAYTEQLTPATLTTALTVSDVEGSNLASAEVKIGTGFQTGDELVFSNQNGITGSYVAGTGVLTLTGSSSIANYQTALRSITFRNTTNDNPTGFGVATLDRSVSIKVNDGTEDSNTVSRTVTVTAVNDAPVVTLDAGTISYTENGTPAVVSPTLTVTDPDNTRLRNIQVTIDPPGYVNGQDTITAGSLPAGVTCSGPCFSTGAGVFQASGAAAIADYQALGRTMAFQSTADDFATLSRVIRVTVIDNGPLDNGVPSSGSAPKTRNLTITPVNDAPTLANVEAGALAYTEQAAAIQVTNTITVTDPDDVNVESAQVRFSLGFQPGDELLFTDQNGITGSYTNGTGIMTLSGASSLANYQTALRSITYRNLTADNPTTSRTIEFRVGDGTANSNLATRAVAITAVNDPPANTVPGPQAGTEDVAKVFSTANGNRISVADAEAVGVQVALTAANGTVTLDGLAGLTIVTGSNGTSTVTVTGTIAAVNAALDGMSFLGNANYNTLHAGDNSLTIVTSDQGATGTGGTQTDSDTVTIDLAAVNDAPVLNAKNVTVQANMGLNDQGGLLTGVTDPDALDPGYVASFTLTAVSPSSCTGCTTSDIQGTGSFDLDVGAGLVGAQTLTYTVQDNGTPVGPAASGSATINLTVSGPVIWFVQATAAPGGDGTMSDPFRTIAAADAVDATGHRIFVSSASYNDGITLNTDERLIGQGVTGTSFDTVLGITPPGNTPARPAVNGTRPIIANTITIGGNNGHVRGVNLTATNVQGIAATGRTGINIGEVSITATNAAAVNFTDSAGTASFTEIDATGGTSGIIWTNASAQNGALTITGTGTADCTSAANCTGGAIQNTTGAGVLVSNLNATTSLSLTNVFVQGTGNEGVNAAGVNGVAFTNVRFHDAGNAEGESGIELNNVTGTGTLTGSVLTRSSENNLYINNSTGSLTFTADDNTISDTTLDAAGNDGISVLGLSSANVTLNVTDSTFSNNDGDHVQVATDTSSTGNYATTIDDNSFTTTNANVLGGGLTMGGGGSGTFDLDIRNNDITGAIVGSFTVGFLQANGAVMNVTVDNNDIGNAATVGSGGSFGIEVSGNTQSTINTLITNNRVRNWNNPAGGIRVLANDTCGVHVPPPPCQPGGTVNATVTGNTVSNPGPFATHGIFIQSGSTANDTNVLCADIGGAGALKNNAEANEANGGADIRVAQRFGTTMRLRGYAGGATDTAAVGTYLSGRNTITTTSVGTPGGTGYLNTSPAGSACPLP